MKKYQAIIIDDERNVREVLQLLLRQYCSEVEVVALASSAAEGREQLKKHDVDIIFLDIDGVLIPDNQERRDIFDSECVKQLRRILEDCPTTHVVFSTSKRLEFSFFKMGWLWRLFDLPLERAIARTPASRTRHRGEEIGLWLAEAPRLMPKSPVRRYAVLDDEPESILEKIPDQHVFSCNPEQGLTKVVADRVIRHFNF